MQTQAKQGFLDRFFKLSEKNTTVKTELLAGLTTFIALAYIIFVNPNILSEAGIPKEAAIASTIWIAALSTMVMGVFANYPVALAPGMGSMRSLPTTFAARSAFTGRSHSVPYSSRASCS